MKKTLLFASLFLLLASCNMTIDAKKTSNKTTSTSINTSLKGKWTLKSLSAFTAIEKGEHYPKYEDGDVVWDFGNKTEYGKVTITKKNAKEKNDNSPAPGTFSFWTGDCIIKIGSSMYTYSVNGNELIIDSNVDPSYGADLAVMRFERM